MITIVDFGDINSREVAEALKKITDDYVVSSNEATICRADKIIFPGADSAKNVIKKIHLLNFFSVLRIIIDKPILGIGLGMQIMCEHTSEGNLSCLGIFPGNVVKFENSVQKAVHEGIDEVELVKDCPLFKDIPDNSGFYFNHSYYLPLCDYTTAKSRKENIEFTSAIQKNLSFGVQFHPEKSGEIGLVLLENFLKL
ncbi:MAG: imidazole glycerol phosphate synthase subunit HisH [Ignavibacterium album]|uniref:imidazole glycerol phosphate synthase subunit HisH n=1 Tax=Ignavibacterium album TaxID=591197 RepID=UPI0026F1705B|nr:imidazole glycerol phosphate synthase subunit HisH [Ignavibacterium album]MBI5661793.1 imidazole glycerol phosphate synthase subunit HisH [Ignavibacterium album]